MQCPAILISALTKKFKGEKHYALEDINTTIFQNQITGLVGPDGAGKTTLIRILSGLLKPTDGRLQYFDQSGINDYRNQIGYMPQKFGLYEDLTVQENMTFYSKLHGIRSHEQKIIFDEMYHFTKLESFQNRLVRFLSGGMKQKLGLACAMMGSPRILLLDEPTVGVDPISRRELWQMCKSLQSQKVSVLWSTSYLDEAQNCDRVILLHEGKIQFDGIPQDFCRTVEGKVYKFTPDPQKLRENLATVLNYDNVCDAVIQGEDLRIVVRTAKPLPIQKSMSLIPARFEDAFISALDGEFARNSVLSKASLKHKMSTQTPIEAIGLTKEFGSFKAANNISFSIRKGEIFGLLGPNGAGKSTTFKMLCGLLQPSHGQALVSGISLSDSGSFARSKIGYMAQKFSLYTDLSVIENLSFFSGIYGLTGKQRTQAIQNMMTIFDLEAYKFKNAGLLPLGFKQRLALSCALMHNPEVLFLDEPTSGVDPLTRREFWVHINSLARQGITIMITTHFMDEAEYCDRIALIYRGKNIATDTPAALKRSVATAQNPTPSLEEAFIQRIQEYESHESITL